MQPCVRTVRATDRDTAVDVTPAVLCASAAVALLVSGFPPFLSAAAAWQYGTVALTDCCVEYDLHPRVKVKCRELCD